MARCPDLAAPQRASWLALPPEPWKNGGGVTRTLAADPDGRWRVSIADIERDGPYSRFPGYDRVSVVLSGEGVTLQGEGVAVPLRPREPAPFRGDDVLQSTLIGGAVRVLNLFVRRGEAVASVTCASVAAGRCDVGGLPGTLAGRTVTQLIVAAQVGRAVGQGGFPGELESGEYLLWRDVPAPDAHPLPATPAAGFAVILTIAVSAASPG
ncbi:HutD family protein [Achromobacter mucicolens]|uniref:HutD/Ves family protein n=1 Tax=Achromobacter mucicolens TaxID=1389922 RepID=UPI00146957DD|nr:HutD family protein [Achromobacter mucicolens]CAB3889343.1 Protein Ves [Achromobacter mucicolens]